MLGNKAVMKISKIDLFDNTVGRSILEMSSDIEKNMCGNIIQYADFARQVEESTDITNKAQLIAFFRFINKNQIVKQFCFAKN